MGYCATDRHLSVPHGLLCYRQLFRYTDFIEGTSIEILNATCPGTLSCNNVTIAICTVGCADANRTCFSTKFQPEVGYKHVFKCSEKFINIIAAKVYFGKANYTVCENGKDRNSLPETCLKHPNATCWLDNHDTKNSINNYLFEVKIGHECTEFRTNYLPYILSGVGVVALTLAAVIIFYNRNACAQCVKGIAQKIRRQGNRIDDLDQINRDDDMPAILRERTLIHPMGPIHHNL
ncbi:unnamed protein product [Mytilus edulis]|uniref:Uncharacterized protein n=1 Tax=Mytilus edulis TaxID=6550 RepID=A0A8S3RQF8_MYTED|nr:unnamed protein product [Mytilus edulis]